MRQEINLNSMVRGILPGEVTFKRRVNRKEAEAVGLMSEKISGSYAAMI